MTESEKLVRAIESLPLESKKKIVELHIPNVVSALKNQGFATKLEIEMWIYSILNAAAMADGKITTNELSVIKAALKAAGITPPITRLGLVRYLNSALDSSSVLLLAQMLSAEELKHLSGLVLAIISADGQMSDPGEIAFFSSIAALWMV